MFKKQLARARAKVYAALFSDRPITPAAAAANPAVIEGLEGRRLMSAGHGGFGGHAAALGAATFGAGGGEFGLFHDGGGLATRAGSTIEFSQAPAAVQTGLTALASAGAVAAPTATTTVVLGNRDGVETYTIDVAGTGTQTRLTVDLNGDPVAAPTKSTTTFGEITNTAVTDEIKAIAAGLGLDAPASTTTVAVSTAADGTATYVVWLDAADASGESAASVPHWPFRGGVVTVDSHGNPTGNQRVPFSTLPTALQDALKDNAPAGATALADTALVDVRTLDGVTTYTATYTSDGTRTTVTVNISGMLTSLPSRDEVEFSTIPQAARDELQVLATADGVSGTISSTQTVTAYHEANGTTVYTVRLAATAGTSSDSSAADTYTISLSVDQAGNPTIPPQSFGGLGRGGFFGGFGGPLGDCGLDGGSTSGGTTTGTTTDTGTTTTPTTTSAAALTPAAATSAGTTTTGTTSTAPTGSTTVAPATKRHRRRHHHAS